MPRIVEACPMRMPLFPAVTEATSAKTCNPGARLQEQRSRERRLPNPARRKWAIGRLRPANPRAKGAPSAAFGRAARCGRRATTDTGASAQLAPGVAVAEEGIGVAAAGTDRSEREP